MIIFKYAKDIDKHLKRCKKQGFNIGFVPTMGALHEGHLSLIKAAKAVCDVTVCSIFVNPTQFNDPADFEKYPITLEKDIALLTDAGCEVLFLPSVAEMYPEGTKTRLPIHFGFLADTLEGEFRPGHFEGMAQIVEKLLRVVRPDQLFMGQKDYQQQLIVGELIRKKKFKTRLVVCPTVREKDGLALSSRNSRLGKNARKQAIALSRTLNYLQSAFKAGKLSITQLEAEAFQKLKDSAGVYPEYLAIRNARTLKPALRRSEKMVALVAARVGGVRLIDNMLLH